MIRVEKVHQRLKKKNLIRFLSLKRVLIKKIILNLDITFKSFMISKKQILIKEKKKIFLHKLLFNIYKFHFKNLFLEPKKVYNIKNK